MRRAIINKSGRSHSLMPILKVILRGWHPIRAELRDILESSRRLRRGDRFLRRNLKWLCAAKPPPKQCPRQTPRKDSKNPTKRPKKRKPGTFLISGEINLRGGKINRFISCRRGFLWIFRLNLHQKSASKTKFRTKSGKKLSKMNLFLKINKKLKISCPIACRFRIKYLIALKAI